MEKHIKTFEDHSTNTHIANFSDLGNNNWSADRVVNNKNGKFSYLKQDDQWVRKDSINQSEQSKVIWMTEEESIELNTLFTTYKEMSDKYNNLLNSHKPSKGVFPTNKPMW